MHGGAYFRDFTVYICFPFHLVDNLYCLLLHDLLFCWRLERHQGCLALTRTNRVGVFSIIIKLLFGRLDNELLQSI